MVDQEELLLSNEFSDWLEELDRLVLGRADMSIRDLPDMPFMDGYAAGSPVDEFFDEVVVVHLRELGWAEDED